MADSLSTYSTQDAPVRGGTMRVGRWQPGPDSTSTVLAVHGITATHMTWVGLAEAGPGLDIIAPDLRGRGRSNHLPGPTGLAHHADDLARVLDHHDQDRVVVAGHSMGGLISVVFADRHPDRVERLVLIDGGLPLYPLPDMTPEQTMRQTLGPALDRLDLVFSDRSTYIDNWLAHPAFAQGANPAMLAFFDYDLEPCPGGFRSSAKADLVMQDAVSQLDPGILTPALERLAVPAVFLRAPRGLLDQPEALYSVTEAEFWSQRLPHLEYVEVPHTNHYTILFHPEPLRLITDLLTSFDS